MFLNTWTTKSSYGIVRYKKTPDYSDLKDPIPAQGMFVNGKLPAGLLAELTEEDLSKGDKQQAPVTSHPHCHWRVTHRCCHAFSSMKYNLPGPPHGANMKIEEKAHVKVFQNTEA